MIDNDENIAVGEKPTQEELFYIDWGYETLKNNLSTLNEIFKVLIVLNTSLVSAYLLLYDRITSQNACVKNLALVFIFFSLISSLIGIYPYGRKVNIDDPGAVKEFKLNKLSVKKVFLWVSFSGLILGLIDFFIMRVWFT